MENLVAMIINFLMYYVLLGIAFGIAFVLFGASRIDPAAKDSSIWFRLIILPATVVFWPFLLVKWIQSVRG